MGEVLTFPEIEQRYKDEWVLIAEPEWDGDIDLRSGVVVFHSPDREAVWERDRELGLKSFALLFMGDALPDGPDGYLL